VFMVMYVYIYDTIYIYMYTHICIYVYIYNTHMYICIYKGLFAGSGEAARMTLSRSLINVYISTHIRI